MPEQSEGNNHMSKINFFFLVAHDSKSTRGAKKGFVCPARVNEIHFLTRYYKNTVSY